MVAGRELPGGLLSEEGQVMAIYPLSVEVSKTTPIGNPNNGYES